MNRIQIQTETTVAARARAHRFDLTCMSSAFEEGPTSGCCLCPEGVVWTEGLVAIVRDPHEESLFLPVCVACLERENPSFLDAMLLAEAALQLAAEGGVTPAMVEALRREDVAFREGEAAAAATPADRLPPIAHHHPEAAVAAGRIALARTGRAHRRLRVDRSRSLTDLALTGEEAPGEEGPSELDRRAYAAAGDEEKPAIAAAARAAYRYKRGPGAAPGSWRPARPHLVPRDYRRRFVRDSARALLVEPGRPEGEALVTALMERCAIDRREAGSALVIGYTGFPFSEADKAAVRAALSVGRPSVHAGG